MIGLARSLSMISLMLMVNTVSFSQGISPIALSIKPAAGNSFSFGLVSNALLVIKNNSDRAIAVRAVKPALENGHNTLSLSGSLYGSIQKESDKDQYIYNSLSQQATEPCFSNGFLLPGQEVTVSCQYRAVSKNETCEISYDISEGRYDGTASSLKPLAVYTPYEKERMSMEFRPFTESVWQGMHSETPAVSDGVGPNISGRTVLIQSPSQQQSVSIKLSIPLADKGFFIEDARKAAAKIMKRDETSIPLAYCAALKGYVIMEKNFSWVLKRPGQKSRNTLLPPVPPALLNDADTQKKIQFRVGEKQEGFGPGKNVSGKKLWGRYSIYYGDGMYTRGEFIDINAVEFLDFLKIAKKKNCSITRHNYYFSACYYQLK